MRIPRNHFVSVLERVNGVEIPQQNGAVCSWTYKEENEVKSSLEKTILGWRILLKDSVTEAPYVLSTLCLAILDRVEHIQESRSLTNPFWWQGILELCTLRVEFRNAKELGFYSFKGMLESWLPTLPHMALPQPISPKTESSRPDAPTWNKIPLTSCR